MKFMIAAETPDWAEHHVNIRTVERRPDSSDSAKRFSVSIGISHFKDRSIRNISTCHVDAQEMHGIFLDRCGVERDNALLIENEQATLANIRKVFKEDLPRLTQPGDTIMVFWSGHGGQTDDGKKEFLVPYDGVANNIESTMLMDETFGRWIQELDSRKVLIILDACNSGGLAAQAKGLAGSLDDHANWKPLRFALDQLVTAKNIGQKDAALIASSTATEVSFVRLEKDLSVFTYYVSETIKGAQRPLTHIQLTDIIKPKVAEYVQEKFTDQRQTVVMQDEMTQPLVLNP